MNNYEYAGGPGPNYGETAVFAFYRKAEKRPKIRFLIWDRDFRQWTICSPRRSGRFGAFRSIFRLFVPELWPFS